MGRMQQLDTCARTHGANCVLEIELRNGGLTSLAFASLPYVQKLLPEDQCGSKPSRSARGIDFAQQLLALSLALRCISRCLKFSAFSLVTRGTKVLRGPPATVRNRCVQHQAA